jgi:hypothetical protein
MDLRFGPHAETVRPQRLDCKGASPDFPLLYKLSNIDTATYIWLIMTDKSQALPRFHYGLPDIYDGAP